MNTRLLKKARELWPSSRYNQLHWARAVHRLGDKWLLAKHVERKT